MSYFEDIDKHMKNGFENYANVETLDKLPTKKEMDSLDRNKVYKVDFAAVAVDVVNFKKMSQHTDDAIFNIIMNEFMYGVIKIMKTFLPPSRIEIQGDSVYAIYKINKRENVDTVFTITCALNTFQENLQKRINKKFPDSIKTDSYSFYGKTNFKFGIGASFSFDNFISVVGQGVDTDAIFMGHTLNCASELSKKASRNNRKSIMFDQLLQFNFTDEQKKRMKDEGSIVKVYNAQTAYKEDIYECNWIMTNYDKYIKNNI